MHNYENVNWNVPDSIKILVTKKNFSPDNEFNISYSGNNTYNETRKNIDFIVEKFLPSKPYFIKQVHGKKVIDLNENILSSYVADGLITSKKNQRQKEKVASSDLRTKGSI